MKFTRAQQQCIDTVGRNLIVSAGAGAGKTATLVERVFRLLSLPDAPCAVDELLIVTFSRAAASEMRERLALRLNEALLDDTLDDALRMHLERQVYLLPRAAISTIHSFCLSLLVSYPEQAGLSPGFDLMSEEETRLFHREFFAGKIDQVLAEPASPHTGLIRRILAELDPVNGVDALIRIVIELHQFLGAVADPTAYISLCREMAEEVPEEYPDSHPVLRLLRTILTARLESLRTAVRQTVEMHAGARASEKYAPQFAHLDELLAAVETALESGRPQEHLPAIGELLKLPRLSTMKVAGTIHDEKFRAARDTLKRRLDREAGELAGFDGGSIADGIARSCVLGPGLIALVGEEWAEELFRRHLELRRLTFGQLERMALQLLTNADGSPSQIAAIVRNQVRHILVDEFQDVNDVQDRIIRALARTPETHGTGNLFFVGDVKQSIYEFRLADPSLFLDLYSESRDFAADLPAGSNMRIDLAENFRSHSALLDEFNRLFELILQEGTIGLDYNPRHAFIAGRSSGKDKARPPRLELHLLPRDPDMDDFAAEDDGIELSLEAEYVARMVEEIGPPWKDICILLRSTVGSAEELNEALSRRNIPVFTDSRLGFLTATEVIEFHTLLRCIDNPYDDIPLIGTLRGPAFRWSEADLLDLRAIDRYARFCDLLARAAESPDHRLREKAATALASIRRWQQMSVNHSMARFFGMLFDELHLLEQASVRPGGDQRRLNLLYILDRARQFDQFLSKGLSAFLQFLEDLIEQDEDIAPPSPLPENADVVRVMTIHKSKGMQFPVVILPFLGRKFNDQSLSRPFLLDRDFGIACRFWDEPSPEDDAPPLHGLVRHNMKMRRRGEELRLLYVALTRAREAVYMTGSSRDPFGMFSDAFDNTPADPPGPMQVLEAQCFLDWVLEYAVRRFPGVARPEDDAAEPMTREDGIARLLIHHMRPAALAVPQAGTEGTDDIDTSGFDEMPAFEQARARIVAHLQKARRAPVRAKISVSELKRLFDATRDRETPPMRAPQPVKPRRIEWLSGELSAAPAVSQGALRGRAMHRFLALCDLIALSSGGARLTGERDRLLQEGFLAAEEAALLNLEDMQWFLNSPLGRRIRGAADRLYREIPFTTAIPPAALEAKIPGDIVVLQGIADLLVGEKDGLLLIDYKTDYCGEKGERIPDLVAGYGVQIRLYAMAIEKTLRQPVREAWLVFLQGRHAEQVDVAEAGEIDWRQLVDHDARVDGISYDSDAGLRRDV